MPTGPAPAEPSKCGPQCGTAGREGRRFYVRISSWYVFRIRMSGSGAYPDQPIDVKQFKLRIHYFNIYRTATGGMSFEATLPGGRPAKLVSSGHCQFEPEDRHVRAVGLRLVLHIAQGLAAVRVVSPLSPRRVLLQAGCVRMRTRQLLRDAFGRRPAIWPCAIRHRQLHDSQGWLRFTTAYGRWCATWLYDGLAFL